MGSQSQGAPCAQEAPQLASLSNLTLLRYCVLETDRYRRENVLDERYCLELFRRAIVVRDEDAWSYLYELYEPLVLSWVNQHPSAPILIGQEGSESLINAVYAKFAQALTPAKMDTFASLAAVLKYLKLCVRSVIADEVRVRRNRACREETLDQLEQEPAVADHSDEVVANLSAQGLWLAVQEVLHGEDERVLVELVYVHGMKPMEISTQHCRLFPSVEDVYRVKRKVVERLRRNRRVRLLAQPPGGG